MRHRKSKGRIQERHIRRFLHKKIAHEHLTDAEIARILGVATTTIFNWRHKFQIPRAEKFERKFTEKYGKDAISVFQRMVDRQATFQEIGDHFGFTREYARQVYQKLYPQDNQKRRKINWK